MLQLRDLKKNYGGRPVLASLSHQFAAGEFVAIMGESGVGKSTLLNLIAGLDAPDSGDIIVDGTPMSALDDDAATRLRRTRMGFIFQAFHVLPHLTLAWGTNLAMFPIMGQPMSFLSAGGSHLLFFICPLLAFNAISAQSLEEKSSCRSMSNTRSWAR